MRLHTESRTEALEVIDACVQHFKLYQRKYPRRCQRGLLFMEGIRDDVDHLCYCRLGNRLFGGGTQSRLEGENADLKELPEIHSKARLPDAVQANTGRVKLRQQSRALKEDRFAHTVAAGTKDLAERKMIETQMKALIVSKAESRLVRNLKRTVNLKVYVRIHTYPREFLVDFPPTQTTYRDGLQKLWVPPQRTRVVKEVTCADWYLPCECLLAVTKGRFARCDLSIRYFVAYAMGNLDEFIHSDSYPEHPVCLSPLGIAALYDKCGSRSAC
jgi:hypothetical protein